MTSKDLKNALLQEAVQGKLVPQIASEGNACDLLKEIQEEKNHADLVSATLPQDKKSENVSSNKIQSGDCVLQGNDFDCRSRDMRIRVTKKEKILPEITDEEKPFDIPENWCWCRLGEIVQINSGDGLTSTEMKKGAIPVFGGNGITGYHNIANIHKETIVIGRVGFYCGSVHITPKEAWVTDNAFITHYPEKQINREYLTYVLRHLNLGKDNNATAQPVVSGKKIYPILFPLPPLAEQKRIVAAIEKFIPLIEEYGKKEEELTKVNANIASLTKKAILQEAVQGKLVPQLKEEGNARDLLKEIQEEKNHADLVSATLPQDKKSENVSSNKIQSGDCVLQGNDFDCRSRDMRIRVIKKEKKLPEITDEEKPFDIPENWCWCRLGEVVNDIADIDHKMPAVCANGIPYISPLNFRNDNLIDFDNAKKISKEDFDQLSKKCKPAKGDIIFPRYGTIGILRTVETDIDFLVSYSCAVIKPHLKNVYSRFIFYTLQSPLIQQNEIQRYINKTTQPNVGLQSIKQFLFPLPPLAEQKRIVAAVEQLLPLCEKLGE